jgi:uracil-DNA glycosylase
MLADTIPPAWQSVLAPVLKSAAARDLAAFVAAEEAAGKAVYPPARQRFAALDLTAPGNVRAVILGQDPYHGAGQAHGLAFSVPDGEMLPPSLRNIYRELHDDCGIARMTGDLSGWARQGVLLLNTSLSVEAGKAGSHAGRGWEAITDALVTSLSACAQPIAFILWGGHAQAKLPLIGTHARGPRLTIESPHPSPLSAWRGFFGSRPFSRTNAFLARHGAPPIDWAA